MCESRSKKARLPDFDLVVGPRGTGGSVSPLGADGPTRGDTVSIESQKTPSPQRDDRAWRRDPRLWVNIVSTVVRLSDDVRQAIDWFFF